MFKLLVWPEKESEGPKPLAMLQLDYSLYETSNMSVRPKWL